MNKFILLPRIVKKNGFTYTHIISNGSYSIYRQRVSEKSEAYEVFRRKFKPESVIFGKVLPAREIFPSTTILAKPPGHIGT